MRSRARHFSELVLLSGMVLWIPIAVLRSFLMELNVLNARELAPFVGGSTAMAREYTLNVWHWEAVGSVLILVAVIFFFTSLLLEGGEWNPYRLPMERMGDYRHLAGGKE